jgi:cytochrome b
MSAGVERTVWDPLVRIGHWLLVVTVVAAWFTRHSPGAWHEWLGYATLAVVVVRVTWGFSGPPHARFADFVRSPRTTLQYVAALFRRREIRHLGHNPLGGWMVVALLVAVAFVGFTGWLYTTDRFWGVEWVEDLHDVSADALVGLVLLHVCGVVFSSVRHRENLIASMLHGRKRIE